jgi:hypothetical protein
MLDSIHKGTYVDRELGDREISSCTVGGQIKLGHLKFNLCKSDHSIVNIFVSVYIICHTKVNLFVTKP